MRGLWSLLEMYLIRKVQHTAVPGPAAWGWGRRVSSLLIQLVALEEGGAGGRSPRPEACEHLGGEGGDMLGPCASAYWGDGLGTPGL